MTENVFVIIFRVKTKQFISEKMSSVSQWKYILLGKMECKYTN